MKTYLAALCLLIGDGISFGTTQSALNQDKPAQLYVKNYTMNDHGSVLRDYSWTTEWDTVFDGNINWSDGVADSGSWTSRDYDGNASNGDPTWKKTTSWSWSGESSPYKSSTMVQTYLVSYAPSANYTNTYIGVDVPIISQIGDINFYTNIIDSGAWPDVITMAERRTAQMTVKLRTGGKATSKQKNLFRLTASASITSPGNQNWASVIGDDYYFMYENSQGPGIPGRNISIGSYGNQNNSGVIYVSIPDNDDVDVTPYVANVDYYTFSLSQTKVQTKTDWQAVVRDEIDRDSGVTMLNYIVANGFLDNRPNINAVYAFYQKVWSERPNYYLWAGLAKLAGAPVYAGLSDADYVGMTTFQNTLLQMNIDVLNDIAWQFEAYRKVGLSALEYVYNTDTSGALNLPTINAWRTNDIGIKQNNLSLLPIGNRFLLQREQQIVLAPGYAVLGSMTGIPTLMSILAKSPVPPGGTSSLYDFSTVVPLGNLTSFTDRWSWITEPTLGIWVSWLNDPNAYADVTRPLLTRAAIYSYMPLK